MVLPIIIFVPIMTMGVISSAAKQMSGQQSARAINIYWASSGLAHVWPALVPHQPVGDAVDAALRRMKLHEPGSIIAIVYLACEIMVPVVASSAVEMFDCERYDDGTTALRADLSIDCDSQAHARMQVFCGIVLFVVIMVVPMIMCALLFPARARMNPPADSEIEALNSRALDESLNPLRSIFNPFRPALWYFGIIDLYRRTAMMCLPILLRWMLPEFSSYSRLLVCTALAFGVVMAYEHVTPFVTGSLGTLCRVSLVQVRRDRPRAAFCLHRLHSHRTFS